MRTDPSAIQPKKTGKPAPAPASPEALRARHQSDLLDEALLETFPASDPVSVILVE